MKTLIFIILCIFLTFQRDRNQQQILCHILPGGCKVQWGCILPRSLGKWENSPEFHVCWFSLLVNCCSKIWVAEKRDKSIFFYSVSMFAFWSFSKKSHVAQRLRSPSVFPFLSTVSPPKPVICRQRADTNNGRLGLGWLKMSVVKEVEVSSSPTGDLAILPPHPFRPLSAYTY